MNRLLCFAERLFRTAGILLVAGCACLAWAQRAGANDFASSTPPAYDPYAAPLYQAPRQTATTGAIYQAARPQPDAGEVVRLAPTETTYPQPDTGQQPSFPQSTPAGPDEESAADSSVETIATPRLNWLADHPRAADVLPPGYCDSGNDEQCFFLDATARAYYVNDQRVEWSGQEATFGAEAAIAPMYQKRYGSWEFTAEGDFYLNQRFDRNILVDSPERVSYKTNFEPDLFEISNLLLSARHGGSFAVLGKMETPFGRYYAPLLTNARWDAPFIRTEAIEWRETGFLYRYERGLFIGEVALTNGGEDRDTNSSKALVSRVGLQGDNFALGGSLKIQDGIGSENQKTYNNHVGVDFMFRSGRFILSGEAIYDQYGLRRPGVEPNDVFWGRSIYYREQYYGYSKPISGVGYYVDLGMEFDRWSLWLNYGEYYPKTIGVEEHDQVNRRGLAKAIINLAPNFQFYNIGILENGGYIAQANRARIGWSVLTGFQAVY